MLEVKHCWCGVVPEIAQWRSSVSDHAVCMQRCSSAVLVLRWCGVGAEQCISAGSSDSPVIVQ